MKQPWLVVLAAALMLGGCAGCNGGGIQQVRPQIVPPAETVDFGTLPVLNEKTIEIELTSAGRAALTVSDFALAKNDGIFTLVSAPGEIAGGVTDTVVVTFKPLAEMAYEDTLTFTTDDVDHPSFSLRLIGVGSTRAILAFEPATVDFGRVAECGSSVALLSIQSRGSADLVINSIAFTADTNPAFTFVGSTRTPAVVATTGTDGLPGEIQLTVRLNIPEGAMGTLTGGILITSTDPDQQSVTVPITAVVNRAPVPVIGTLGNGAPGQTIALDGSGSSDPDADDPITFAWTMRSKPLASNTTIADPDAGVTSMTLDPMVPGAYEVQLDVTDSTGAKSCTPARATVVAAPAQKILVEMFWDNAGTDVDLHVLKTTNALLNTIPNDCYYQNRAPDWGVIGSTMDDPELVRDALTGYGPEVFGYVNPIDGTFRVASVLQNTLLSPTPDSKVTVRVYIFGVLKAEVSKTLADAGASWDVVDITWPSGDVAVVQ